MDKLSRFFDTDRSFTLALLRVAAGAVMLPHGAQKLFGWFGGRGFAATMSGLQEHAGVPAFVALLVILGESLGALGMVVGAGARLGAFGVVVTMLGAMRVHADNGFFMNWGGQQAGEGYEFHLLMIALALPVMVRGAGAWSIDRWIAGRLDRLARP